MRLSAPVTAAQKMRQLALKPMVREGRSCGWDERLWAWMNSSSSSRGRRWSKLRVSRICGCHREKCCFKPTSTCECLENVSFLCASNERGMPTHSQRNLARMLSVAADALSEKSHQEEAYIAL